MAGATRQFKLLHHRLTSYGFCVLLVPLLASLAVRAMQAGEAGYEPGAHQGAPARRRMQRLIQKRRLQLFHRQLN